MVRCISGADNVPQCGDWKSTRGSWRRFPIRWPAKRLAADDAVDQILRKWSRLVGWKSDFDVAADSKRLVMAHFGLEEEESNVLTVPAIRENEGIDGDIEK